ncbi:MAG: YggS family pyridoxal phosphate-dependent enzyme [Bacteroidales bacterium]|nr:YggS family pyridoxal phosphate-dependent enzyme [Bacteroidales bacterium]
MGVIGEQIAFFRNSMPAGVKLVAVSKFKPVEAIMEAYEAGQRVFAENRPLEFQDKARQLPADIEWHFIGHLQTNKVKNVVPYAALIQSIDSEHLLKAVNDQAAKVGKVQDILLEVFVASETTKHGLSADEAVDIAARIAEYGNVRLRGVMAMATFTDDMEQVRREFGNAAAIGARVAEAAGIGKPEISMGMTSDYEVAIECGSTMVRIGTAIFGAR